MATVPIPQPVPPGINPPAPAPVPPGTQPGQFPVVLKWSVALLVVGGLAEWLDRHVSPTAGYSLVAIVLLGYVAQHGTTAFSDFFNNVFGGHLPASGRPPNVG